MKARKLIPLLKSLFLSGLSGTLAGVATSAFLFLLNQVTSYRSGHLAIIWLLPIAGYLIGFIYDRFGSQSQSGNNLIIDQILLPKERLPFLMAPLILLSTLITHLFGGSVGREGTAVQMGASLSDQLSRFFPISAQERKILLISGAGAGFGAAIGTPWAGVFFGMEMIHFRRFKIVGLLECMVASWVAYGVTIWLKAPHTILPRPSFVSLNWHWLLAVCFCGVLWGLLGGSFVRFTHFLEGKFKKGFSKAPVRTFIGGLILVILFSLEGSYRYVGLGISSIQEAFFSRASILDVIYKFGFTALTIGAGFKGGEFIPLVFMGTCLGSFFSHFFPGSQEILASVGFAAVFAGTSKTPFSCSLVILELFGFALAPYALLGCFMSYLVASRLDPSFRQKHP